MNRTRARAWASHRIAFLSVPEEPTKFELRVKRLGLADSPEKWRESMSLRAWVKSHKNRAYVPEWLLHEFGLAGYYEGD